MFKVFDQEKSDRLLDRYYPHRKFHDALYGAMIRKYLRSGERVLDAGCGRYLKFCKQLSDTGQMVGIDLETTLETDNRNLPFGVRGDLGHLPFPPATFDMVISRSVIEHLDDPEAVFREFYRVLRPGGRVVVITPNKYDYVSVIAALTPYWIHQTIVSKICKVPEGDVYPTRYRSNTLSAMGRAFRSAGFVSRELDTINHYPAYLMFSDILFRLGVLYERMTSLRMFRSLRSSILGVFEKPGTPEGAVPHARRESGVAVWEP
jgi:ubiquinone/menaquinone biosynthesis C-methylase UbiE